VQWNPFKAIFTDVQPTDAFLPSENGLTGSAGYLAHGKPATIELCGLIAYKAVSLLVIVLYDNTVLT